MVTLGRCHLDSQYHNEGSLCHGDRKGTHMSRGPYRDKVPESQGLLPMFVLMQWCVVRFS